MGVDPAEILPEDFGITVIGSGVKIADGATVGAKALITEDIEKERA